MKKLLLLLLIPSVLLSAELTLTWSDNSSNEDGFRIDRSLNGVSWLPVWEVGANVETWTDGDLEGDQTYFYRVAAFNAAGQSGWSNVAQGTTRTEILPDGVPGSLGVTGEGTLVNLSTRGPVNVDSILIGGLVVSDQPILVLIRGIGPTLTDFGVPGAMLDPQISLRDAGGAPIATNDNWSGQGIIDASSAVGAFPLTPGTKDSAILMTLSPGSYTVHLSGVGGTTGTALLEIYHVK